MADLFTLHLSDDEVARLRIIAESVGQDPGDYARDVLSQAVEDDWAEDQRRFAEYERTGQSISLETFMAGLYAAIDRPKF